MREREGEMEKEGNGDPTTEKSECDMKYLQGLQRGMSRNRSAQDGSLLLAHTHSTHIADTDTHDSVQHHNKLVCKQVISHFPGSRGLNTTSLSLSKIRLDMTTNSKPELRVRNETAFSPPPSTPSCRLESWTWIN